MATRLLPYSTPQIDKNFVNYAFHRKIWVFIRFFALECIDLFPKSCIKPTHGNYQTRFLVGIRQHLTVYNSL